MSKKIGTVGGSPVYADQSRIDHSVSVAVRLTANYTLEPKQPGDLTRPSLTGCAASNLDFARTIPSGTVLKLFRHEADALVAAGAATYV